MKIEGAKHLFYERLDQWTDDYKAASELRLKVTEAFANVANNVAVANVSGAVAFANVANSVAVANVSGIGNIATVNLDGNVSNVLRGDGTFAGEAGNLNANYANFAGQVTDSNQPNSD